MIPDDRVRDNAVARLAILLAKNEAIQITAIVMFVAGVIAGLVFLVLEKSSDELLAAVSTNYSTIDYGKVACVSIAPNQVTVEGAATPDPKLAESITDILSIKTVLFDAGYAECPWDFFVNVAPGTTFAIRDGFLPAQYLVSVGICERTDDKHVNPNNCLSKNVWVFNWRAKPHDLFRVGLIGLRPDTPEMEQIRMRVEGD
jgi:hypothetical protein